MIVDCRAKLQKRGQLFQTALWQLGWKVWSGLKVDHQQRVEGVAEKVEGCLAAGEPQETWRLDKVWCCSAVECAPKPFFQTIEQQMEEKEELYH